MKWNTVAIRTCQREIIITHVQATGRPEVQGRRSHCRRPQYRPDRRYARTLLNDHDRTASVRRALLTHRTEQQAAEPTQTSGTHDEEVGTIARFEERWCRWALVGDSSGADLWCNVAGLLRCVLHESSHGPFYLTGREQDVSGTVGGMDFQEGTGPLRLDGRPFQGPVSVLRAIDSDHYSVPLVRRLFDFR